MVDEKIDTEAEQKTASNRNQSDLLGQQHKSFLTRVSSKDIAISHSPMKL